MNFADYKRHAHYGPGGRYCPCCGPSPSERKRADRMVRRREKQHAYRELRQEIEGMEMQA